jgi:glycosyltransferase involved in cell wall biosynthesis
MTRAIPRVVALLAAYNEERFIAGCLEHLLQQNVDIYLIDNCSSDQTVTIARRYMAHGLIGIETVPRAGMYSWRPILERKEQLANTLDADWFMLTDPDEIRLPPRACQSLAQGFAEAEGEGCNAVNFEEFTFIPTREAPDHDHQDFQKTMRWYYPFLTSPALFQVKAWKRQPGPVEFAWSAGHQVRFEGLRIFPQGFRMRHYFYLSVPHAIRKYVEKRYDPAEVEVGWHRLRARVRPETIKLPAEAELRPYLSDDELDPSNPRVQHYLFDAVWAEQQEKG